MSKHNEPQPQQIIGGEGASVFIDNAAIGMRGGITRIAFCEGQHARSILAMQTSDALAIAQQIIAGQQEMLRQAMERTKQPEAPSSPIPVRN